MLWVKTFHVLGVMAWLAGIFYLPRIFVHYAEGSAEGEDVRRLHTMARKLYGFMTVMGFIATALGVWLWLYYRFSGIWLNVKLLLVFGLMIYHLFCGRMLMRMLTGAPLPSPLRLRILNEAALLLIVPILIMVIVKPF
jgi:protoporphyrinogen IX oxidase